MIVKQEANQISLNDDNDNDKMLAVVTFPKVEEGVVSLDHTFVDPSLRGQGVGTTLMDAAVEYFRANHLKVKPSCSFAAKYFEEHPESHDVLFSTFQ